jgi:hypothetical protein
MMTGNKSTAYWEGYDAFFNGLVMDENPYDPVMDKAFYLDWEEGYIDASHPRVIGND